LGLHHEKLVSAQAGVHASHTLHYARWHMYSHAAQSMMNHCCFHGIKRRWLMRAERVHWTHTLEGGQRPESIEARARKASTNRCDLTLTLQFNFSEERWKAVTTASDDRKHDAKRLSLQLFPSSSPLG